MYTVRFSPFTHGAYAIPVGFLRVVYGTNATLALDQLTIQQGQLTTGNGMGLYFSDCTLMFTNCVVRDNSCSPSSYTGHVRGGGVYLANCATTFRSCLFTNNVLDKGNQGSTYGGAVYASGGSLSLRDCLLRDNYVDSYGSVNRAYGGSVYASGTTVTPSNCMARSNFARGQYAYGGALWVNSKSVDLIDTAFARNVIQSSGSGGAIYVQAGSTVRFRNCDITNNTAEGTVTSGDIRFKATGSGTFENCRISANYLDGICTEGADVTVSNCLFAGNGRHGLYATAGNVRLFNSTLAYGTGYGLRQTGGTTVMTNCLAWGNVEGGIDAATASIGYTFCQEPQAGVSNRTSNPQLVFGYYLSVSGLQGQSTNSPCINAGLGDASDYGLDARTTRTDGTADAVTVDVGYHPAAGLSAAAMSNITLYVDAVAGDDGANDGLAPDQAFKTISMALSRAIAGTTIHVAAGTYDPALGEQFPLVLNQMNLSLLGTNVATTVLDAANVQRVCEAINRGTVRLEALTLKRGYLSPGPSMNGYGAAAYLNGCRVTLTNCIVRDSRIFSSQYGLFYGGGLYLRYCVSVLDNCQILDNYLDKNQQGSVYGGGIYTVGGSLALLNSRVEGNWVESYGSVHQARGGGAYCTGTSLLLSNCLFRANDANGMYAYGGGLWANSTSVDLLDSAFTRNVIETSGSGGALFFENGSVVRFRNCAITNNTTEDLVTSGEIRFGTSGSGVFQHCRIMGNYLQGIRTEGAGLILSNSLVAANGGHGLYATAGDVRVFNSTLADNAGYGLLQTGGTTLMTNCILWANVNGGIAAPAATVGYTFCQEPQAGVSNRTSDPQLVFDYYLSVSALQGQSTNSPCINAGLGDASDHGLDTRTTRTDSTADADTVDVGYHHASGLTPSFMSNAVLYVNAVTGDDVANNGFSPEQAFLTIGKALEQAIHGTIIHIAAGTYDAGLGESFPLTLTQLSLSLMGTNAAVTVLDAANAARILEAMNGGHVILAGIMLKRGRLSPSSGQRGYGAGAYFSSSRVSVSNCIVRDCRIAGSGYGTYYGGGLYLRYCASDISGCLVTNNTLVLSNQGKAYGGGICASGGSLVLQDSTLAANVADAYGSVNQGYGGGLFCSAPFTVSNCLFTLNDVETNPRGGAMYVSGAGSIRSSQLVGNGTSATRPGSTYIAGGAVDLVNTLVADNYGDGVRAAGGTLKAANNTFADNTAWGLDCEGGTVVVSNGVAWGNSSGGIDTVGVVTVTFTCSQRLLDGEGNLNTDPLFVNAATRDYHLQSTAGSWHNDVEAFVSDAASSIGIDAGDPTTPWSDLEPAPNGGKVNMGAYGNTSYASKTAIAGTIFVFR